MRHKRTSDSGPRRGDGRRVPVAHKATPNSRHAATEPERLQKVLARAGLASRREVEDWIRAGRITVNGEAAVLGVRVGPADHVRLDGRLIRQREVSGAVRVFLCHRSPGENLQPPVEGDERTSAAGDRASAAGRAESAPDADDAYADNNGREANTGRVHGGRTSSAGGASSVAASTPAAGSSLVDRIPRRAGRRFISVSPMPRVDGGLELVTSDGDLAAKLQRAMRGITSEFSVRVHGELQPEGIESILEGILDNGEKLAVERCEASGGEGSNRWYSFAARGASGKEVRQLFERQGALVSRVLRTQLGPLALDRNLSRGHFRELSAEELGALLAAASGG